MSFLSWVKYLMCVGLLSLILDLWRRNSAEEWRVGVSLTGPTLFYNVTLHSWLPNKEETNLNCCCSGFSLSIRLAQFGSKWVGDFDFNPLLNLFLFFNNLPSTASFFLAFLQFKHLFCLSAHPTRRIVLKKRKKEKNNIFSYHCVPHYSNVCVVHSLHQPNKRLTTDQQERKKSTRN